MLGYSGKVVSFASDTTSGFLELKSGKVSGQSGWLTIPLSLSWLFGGGDESG